MADYPHFRPCVQADGGIWKWVHWAGGQPRGQIEISWLVMAIAAACVVLVASNEALASERCFRTVLTVIPISRAMAWFDIPRAANDRASHCRLVKFTC